jgi:hypothetical protein
MSSLVQVEQPVEFDIKDEFASAVIRLYRGETNPLAIHKIINGHPLIESVSYEAQGLFDAAAHNLRLHCQSVELKEEFEERLQRLTKLSEACKPVQLEH